MAENSGKRDQAGEAREIDRVLAAATNPQLPAGAGQRLLARLGQTPRVVPLAAPQIRSAPVLGWEAALPLAASLALGIYLGAMGTLDRFLPESGADETVLVLPDDAELGGVSEAEAYAEEDLS